MGVTIVRQSKVVIIRDKAKAVEGRGHSEASKNLTIGMILKRHSKGVRNSVHSNYSSNHRLNMELDLQSFFGLLCTAVLIG